MLFEFAGLSTGSFFYLIKTYLYIIRLVFVQPNLLSFDYGAKVRVISNPAIVWGDYFTKTSFFLILVKGSKTKERRRARTSRRNYMESAVLKPLLPGRRKVSLYTGESQVLHNPKGKNRVLNRSGVTIHVNDILVHKSLPEIFDVSRSPKSIFAQDLS